MKKILVVSGCEKRNNSIGLVESLLSVFKTLDKTQFHISLFDTYFLLYESHNPNDYPVDQYFSMPKGWFYEQVQRLPKIRLWVWFANRLKVITYKKLFKKQRFDIVVVHQVPSFADELVTIAHTYGAKIVFAPFGSDILRANDKTRKHLLKAFEDVDAVVGRTKSNVVMAVQEVYNVPKSKIKEQRECLRSISDIKQVRGLLSREEMHKNLGLPFSNYNIVCGYNGSKAQSHKKIIDALVEVKNILPEGYQIVFPMTYGPGDFSNYVVELKSICDSQGLNTFFITDFKTRQQMACLHLVTDLFIEIQPTDNGNAFMIEALFAQNQIVTGRWLNYQRFEQFGLPYYLIDSPDELSNMLRKIFTHQVERAHVPQELIDFFDYPDGYDRSAFWIELFNSI